MSSYQGSIDFRALSTAGLSFVMTKATEGLDYTDRYLASNFAGISGIGLVRGAYHFGHPSIDAVAQAQYFVRAVQNAGGFKASPTLPLMLDLEDADGLGPDAVWAWVQAFMGEVKALTGRPGLIYTGYYFWRDNVGNPGDNLGCPLWIAAYISHPLVPAPAWGGWTFWQYNDNGQLPGISGNVDVDYFSGSVADLKSLCL